ncbi:hypothetical protein [Roseofilum casamattae]|uniref:Uncharacterized protein n=1 Tax=Roseofilum casamattae BLCC-M143 TaxID=3022442 RepID=A0ABT7C136_9CYAN|nr:hypothetical protein [Roseofilum casamattae]MDJ1184459.1 hypothetical protein [Roseofilum casamattae BLCC-M143]
MAFTGGLLAIAALAQPSWGLSDQNRFGITNFGIPNRELVSCLENYQPPDNGKPDSTGDTGGR